MFEENYNGILKTGLLNQAYPSSPVQNDGLQAQIQALEAQLAAIEAELARMS